MKTLRSAFQCGVFRRAGAAAGRLPRFFMGLWKNWDSARKAGLLRQLGAYVRKRKELALHFFRDPFREKAPGQKTGFCRPAGALALILLVAVSSIATVMASTRTATVNVDGAVQKVAMTSEETESILHDAGVKVSPQDLVSRKDDPQNAGDVILTVRTARKAVVSADGNEKAVLAHYGDTVDDALAKAGVRLDADDAVTPSGKSAVGKNMKIRVTRMMRITVTADGRTVPATVKEGSVSDAVRQAGVPLDADDALSADPNARVSDGMTVKVSRVAYREVSETRAIPYKTVEKKDASLAAGTKKVGAAGQEGAKTVVVRQKLVDGKLAGAQDVRSTVTKQPVDRVVLSGTKKKSGTARTAADGTLIDHNGRRVRYKKVLTGRCSAYTGGGRTSTGRKAAFGLVAVNPKIIPYGTRLYIASPNGKVVYGYAIAADTGGAAMRGAIIADLYYDSYAQCIQIGSRTMNVYIL